MSLAVYFDSDWAGEPQENEKSMQSTTGLIAEITEFGNLYTYSGLQDTIFISSHKTEYRAGGAATQVCVEFCNVLAELDYPQLVPSPLYRDNAPGN